MVGLELHCVDHAEASPRLWAEGRNEVAGLGHRVDGARVDALSSRPNPQGGAGLDRPPHLTPADRKAKRGPVVVATSLPRSPSPLLIQRPPTVLRDTLASEVGTKTCPSCGQVIAKPRKPTS